MEIGPIWRAILSSKGSYLLIALQIAVTMAIMVNAIAIMQERADKMARPSGTDEDNILTLLSIAFVPDINVRSLIDEDLAMLRSMPGVRDAFATNSFPLRGGGWSMGLATQAGPDQDGVGTAIYFADEHALNSFGTNLIEGRNFAPQEISWDDSSSSHWPAMGIISEALARQLFPEEKNSVVGKTVFINESDPVQIVGVVDRLQAPWNGWEPVSNSYRTTPSE